jgi:hypothetical protein
VALRPQLGLMEQDSSIARGFGHVVDIQQDGLASPTLLRGSRMRAILSARRRVWRIEDECF